MESCSRSFLHFGGGGGGQMPPPPPQMRTPLPLKETLFYVESPAK